MPYKEGLFGAPLFLCYIAFMLLDTYIPAAFIFLYGLAIGSFLNVVIFRLPRHQGIAKGGSACPGCGNAIKWYDNIPVLSYIILRGKCRACGTRISPRYPVVELLTAVLLTAIYFQLVWIGSPYGGLEPAWTAAWILRLLAYLWFGAALIACAFIDAEHRIIPNRIVFPTFVIGLVLLLGANYHAWTRMLLGILAGGGIPLLLLLLSPLLLKRQGMGMGDVKLGATMGLFLGWQLVLLAIFFASLFGSFYNLPKMFGGPEKRRQVFPFGPFLAIGALTAFFVGMPIITWYLGLFSL